LLHGENIHYLNDDIFAAWRKHNSAKLITIPFFFVFFFIFFSFAAATPLAWAGPDDCPDLHLNRPGLLPCLEAPVFDHVDRPAKKQATTATKEMYSSKPNHNW
jgi:hypothetical protein